MILTDHSDDALLIPLGVLLSWQMLIYVTRRVSDTAIQMTQSHLKCVVFSGNGDNLYNRVHNMSRIRDTLEVTQKLDCVTVMFPEAVFVRDVS